MLVVLGELGEHGELLALRAAGFSPARITWPFLAAAVLLSALLLFLNHKASPEGLRDFRGRYASAILRLAKIDLQARTFLTAGPWRLHAQEADRNTGQLQGVYLVKTGSDYGMRLSSERGRFLLDEDRKLILMLEDGRLELPSSEPERVISGRFRRYSLKIPLTRSAPLAREPDAKELDSRTLRERARDPLTPSGRRTEYSVEIMERSALALSPFVFFWIAAPLGLEMERNSRRLGFAASLLILFVFYGLLAVGVILGRRQEALSSFAPWLADVAGLILGAGLTAKAAKL
jgi:lipopolysaccharide export system permease protein